jgi:hypothetical protein
MKRDSWLTSLYLMLLLLAVISTRTILRRPLAPTRVNAAVTSASASGSAASIQTGCLSSHDGFLRARMQRAHAPDTRDAQMDIDWGDADMECDGEPRPGHRGIRLTFAGHLPGSGARVRLVFGIAADPNTPSVRNVPANVTVIFEDEQKLYSTAGDDKCTIDELTVRDTRFVARGFCTGPASLIAGSDTLLVQRFDFAGLVRDEDAP